MAKTEAEKAALRAAGFIQANGFGWCCVCAWRIGPGQWIRKMPPCHVGERQTKHNMAHRSCVIDVVTRPETESEERLAETLAEQNLPSLSVRLQRAKRELDKAARVARQDKGRYERARSIYGVLSLEHMIRSGPPMPPPERIRLAAILLDGATDAGAMDEDLLADLLREHADKMADLLGEYAKR